MDFADLDSVGPVEFGRRPSAGQATLFDESSIRRESQAHEGKLPGEFAPKRPQTPGGQMLLVDSGVNDQPTPKRTPVESAMPPEVTGPVQATPIHGQRSLFDGVQRIEFTPHSTARMYPRQFTTVHADSAKLDREWGKEPDAHLPSDGIGESEVDGRREAFRQFMATGKPIEQPHVVMNASKRLAFEDGRHRTRVLIDAGHKTIPLSVPISDAKRIQELVGADQLSQDFSRESIGPVEFSSWDESKHPRESDFHDNKRPGEFTSEGGNGHELYDEDAARTQRAEQAAAGKPPETFASTEPLPKPWQFWQQTPLSEILGDVPPRPEWLRKRDQITRMPWTDAHESAQHAAAQYDVNIDDVVATMPAAHSHILDGMVERERAKTEARRKTGLNAGLIARLENSYQDLSTSVPRFDEISREIAAEFPGIIGAHADDHDTPQKVWDFIREGKQKLPSVDSRETADVAASMLASARKSAGPVHFHSDEDEEPEDEWTVVHGDANDDDFEDTGFDPSQFSRRDTLDEIEDAEKIAKLMGVSADELLAAITDLADGVRATIRNRSQTVIGLAIRHGDKIEIRDANSKLAGTITRSGSNAMFRDRDGRIRGSIGPVEFARAPAANQLRLWDEQDHPRSTDGKFADKLHHSIKEYLSDGTRRNLRDIHAHTGDIKTDTFNPTSNPTTAALRSLRDSGDISSQEPDYAEPMFYMTEEQRKNHADSVFASPSQNVSEEADLKKMEVGRTRTAIHFDPPIVGPSGSQLASYEWKYEWVMDDEKGPDPVRVSNWNEAEFNEHTKRNIVHSFGVTDDSGEHHTTSLETAVKMLGLVKNSAEISKVKNLAQAAIKLAQAKQDHEKLLSSREEQEKSGFKYRISSSEQKIADLTAKMAFLNREAAMMNGGKSPVQHYRDVSRKLHALLAMFRTHNGGRWGSDRVAEFVKEAGGGHEEQREKRVAGYALYKDVVRANGMNILGEESASTPLPDGKHEATYFGRKVQAVPPWSDQKMRNWFSKHGEEAEVAIEKAHEWLKKHHPNYTSIKEHSDFAALKTPEEFLRDPGPVEFARHKPADSQSVLDFDEPPKKKEPNRDASGRTINPITGQVQARKGGEVSEVDNEWYNGGEWMPIHGMTKKTEPKAKAMAAPAMEGKPNEQAKAKYTTARTLSAEDLESAQQKKADQTKWDEIKGGPLGQVKWLGDSPNQKGMHYLTSMNQWHDYADAAGPAEIKRITGELESIWRHHVKEALADRDDLPSDSVEWFTNTPKIQAEEEMKLFPRANGTHEKRVPGSAYARQLVQHLIEGDGFKKGQRAIDRMHDIHRVMSGSYESEFSREDEPVEFARHSFCSTQFNISDAGYTRTQGSPIPLLEKLVQSIPDDEIHEGERESADSLHVTVKYGIHTEDADEIESIVQGFGPVKIKLGKVSIFPADEKKSFDVVKVTVLGDDIHRLNSLIKDSTECTDTYPHYKPHITLAYVNPGEGAKYVGNTDVEGLEMSFDAMLFCDKDRGKTKISLIPNSKSEAEWSRGEDWVLAPVDDGPVEFARPIRPGAGQQSMGFSDDEQPHDVSSSSIHSFRFEPNGPGGGNLIVRYLDKKKEGPGPEYRYFTGSRNLFDRMNADAQQGRSMGGFVWDHLRIRGSVAGHTVPFELAGTGPDRYIPRAAGLKRGHTGEWFNTRRFQGQESSLAPGPVRKSNGPIPGYDPSKLKLPGEKPQATQAPKPATSPPVTPAPSPMPQSPPSPAAAPNPSSPPSPPAPKKPTLVERVLGFFRRKPKDQKPKEFSREDLRNLETVYASLFREPANLKFDEARDPD